MPKMVSMPNIEGKKLSKKKGKLKKKVSCQDHEFNFMGVK